MRFFVFVAGALAAHAYVPYRTPAGAIVSRPDFANIQLYVHESIAPGLRNSEGALLITEDSDPLAAIQEGANTWSTLGSSAVRFAPVERTPIGRDAMDGRAVILFADSPELQSVIGSALAITALRVRGDGVVFDTDIIFSSRPRTPFSTTLNPETIDLQSIVTHELGHTLGANHSGLLGAAMYQATTSGADAQRYLSTDDIAFLTQTYPAPEAAGSTGAIEGRVMFEDGRGVRIASIVAIDRATGVSIQGLADRDGSYRIGSIPPGDYEIYAEPVDGPVLPNSLGMDATDFDTQFSTTIGDRVNVSAGSNASRNITVLVGRPSFEVELAGLATAASAGAVPLRLTRETSVDVLLFGRGLDSVTDVSVLGRGMSIRPDSLRIERILFISGYPPPLRFTVDVSPEATGLGSILLRRDDGTVAWSGGLSMGAFR
jgi:hypothetical protein